MGWSSLHRAPGIRDIDFFQDECVGTEGGELIDAFSKNGEFYAAWRLGPRFAGRGLEGQVIALVALYRRGRGDWNFSYKAMTEDMGPFVEGCPDRILNLLSPTDNENALEWRARCRARNTQLAARPVVRPGTTVRFVEPLNFTDGSELDTFTFERGSVFRSGYRRFRIPRWRDRSFEVLPPQDT